MSVTKTIKSSGGDYTTLAAWEDGMDGNLTGSGYSEAICYAIDDVTAVTISGWTTTASDYIYIHTDSSAYHGGIWNGDKYNLVVANGTAFGNTEDYVRVDGLQIQVSPTNSNGQRPISCNGQTATNNEFRLSNTIIRGSKSATYDQSGVFLYDSDLIANIFNCIIYDVPTFADGDNQIIYCGGATNNIYSCVGIGGYRGLQTNAGTTNAKNCFMGGSAVADSDFHYVAGTLNKTNCASEDSSADDTGANETATNCSTSVAIDTDTFVNVTVGSEDFHLAADGLSPLEDAGVNTSGESAPLNFTTDIDGDTITTFPIGVDFRYVAPAAGFTNEMCLIMEC